MQIDTREVACGAVFVIAAGLFAWGSLTLPLGTTLRMGPGYFPLVLALVLGLLGAIIVVKGFGRAPSPLGGVAWRGLLFILVAPVVFGLTVRGLGLVPSIAIVVAITTLASMRADLKLMAGLVVGLTVFCVVVFSYGLGLPYARFGPWVAPLIGM